MLGATGQSGERRGKLRSEGKGYYPSILEGAIRISSSARPAWMATKISTYIPQSQRVTTFATKSLPGVQVRLVEISTINKTNLSI